MKNEYMEQVMVAQANVEGELRKKARRAPVALAEGAVFGTSDIDLPGSNGTEAPAVDVRITGLWRWKNVIVPPNVYVVHTRRGRDEPLHIGLGTSFRFNPVTDSFLVVPAAMQTIIINANCISREKQGILVQGYVQWVIDDFETAYRRLDFSDSFDPMRVVNVQLREQAEAVIKDTVATMSLEAVLADRQPIIKELTDRLRNIMEGEEEHQGLGLSIVTVQIKEAVVSSATVWETLQRPFRAERAKEARIAELAEHNVIREREAEDRKAAEATRIEADAAIARRRAEAEAKAFDHEQAESARRARIEAEALTESIEHEKEKAAKRAELAELTATNENRIARLRVEAANARARIDIETDAARREVANKVSDARLRELLIDALPEIVERMPKPDELKSVQINGADGVGTLLPALVELVDSLRNPPSPSK